MLIRSGGWTQRQWRALAQGALTLGQIRLAVAAWTAAAHADPVEGVDDLYHVALVWLADDRAARAGRLCLRLAQQSTSPAQQVRLFRLGVAWLQGARGAAEALAQAREALRHMADWRAEQGIAVCVGRLAMAADRPAVAASLLAAALAARRVP